MVTQQRLHETLQRQGGFIPGIRPGKRTQEYIKRWCGALRLLVHSSWRLSPLRAWYHGIHWGGAVAAYLWHRIDWS